MPKEIQTVKCPLCGWHHPIERTGIMRLQRGEPADQRKGPFEFAVFDLNQGAFISIREVKGRGGGLPEIGRVTLEEARSDPQYKLLISSLVKRSYQILKIVFP